MRIHHFWECLVENLSYFKLSTLRYLVLNVSILRYNSHHNFKTTWYKLIQAHDIEKYSSKEFKGDKIYLKNITYISPLLSASWPLYLIVYYINFNFGSFRLQIHSLSCQHHFQNLFSTVFCLLFYTLHLYFQLWIHTTFN